MTNLVEPEIKVVEVNSIVDHEIGQPLEGGTVVLLDIEGKQPIAEVCMTRSEAACPGCVRSGWCGARFGKER